MKQVWQAEDGSVFQTEKECENYEVQEEAEEQLRKQIKKLKAFVMMKKLKIMQVL